MITLTEWRQKFHCCSSSFYRQFREIQPHRCQLSKTQSNDKNYR